MPDAYRIDLDRPRSVGEMLAATARLYHRYPLLFVILALAVVAQAAALEREGGCPHYTAVAD
jgi:hypothetical protein